MRELIACPNGNISRPSCKKRSCPFCGPRWARDWRRVLGVNLDEVGGAVATLAVTPPGRCGNTRLGELKQTVHKDTIAAALVCRDPVDCVRRQARTKLNRELGRAA